MVDKGLSSEDINLFDIVKSTSDEVLSKQSILTSKFPSQPSSAIDSAIKSLQMSASATDNSASDPTDPKQQGAPSLL